MLEIEIPGRGSLRLTHLLLDLNGTLTTDSQLDPATPPRLTQLSQHLEILIISADTNGRLAVLAETLGVNYHRLEGTGTAQQKRALAEQIGADQVVAIGNGANDALMLEAAALGIAILGPEGASRAALLAADLVVTQINAALDCLLILTRLIATLRD